GGGTTGYEVARIGDDSPLTVTLSPQGGEGTKSNRPTTGASAERAAAKFL
ncbi:MAG: hypothetical protein RL616_309, partial [Verrucomicrobiota bacterium]